MPVTFEGIRAYRKGSFVVQQINNKEETESEYGRKMNDLLNGTAYGNYIYKNEYKQNMPFKKRKAPATASIYCQLIFNSNPLKISVNNGLFYVNGKIETNRRIYCDVLPNKYKNELLLVKKHKRYFNALINALADNRVYYDSALSYEAMNYFLQWLSI